MNEIEKLNLESADLVTERIAQLKALFPEAFAEGGIDFDKLRLLLGDEVDEGTERYGFTWPGKRDAIRQSQTPSRATLRPAPEESVDWDSTQNLYIEGDNLEVLKLLQRAYHGKVKMIYIDPPYNTGNDFVYKDSFGDTIENYKRQAGLAGQSNPKTSGRFHSDWCSMIYPRLMLARELLADDGVIFISIDDNEVANLEQICDEIFGEMNHPETLHFQVRYGNKSLNERDAFQKLIEYTLIYCKDYARFNPRREEKDYDVTKFCLDIRELGAADKSLVIDGKKVDVFLPGSYSISKVSDEESYSLSFFKETWVTGSIYSGTGHGVTYQKVVEPRAVEDGYGVLYKIWGLGEDGLGYRYMTGPQREVARYGKMYNKIPIAKLDAIRAGRYKKKAPVINFFDYSADYGNIRHEGGVAFNSGKKPVKMLRRLIDLANLSPGDIVLDFFSGSASVAEAVMRESAQCSQLSFIMVQLPELCAETSEVYKSGFKTISDVGKERIRRAGAKIAAEMAQTGGQLELGADVPRKLDIGFRVFKLDESGISRPQEGDLIADVRKPGRSDEDIIFEMMLKWGLELTLPVKKVEAAGYPCWSVAEGELVCCLASGLTMQAIDAIADMAPRRVLLLDSILDDMLKLNAVKALRRARERTGREVELRTV